MTRFMSYAYSFFIISYALTCFKGPKARSHDFFIIKWLESDSLEDSVWTWLTEGLKPGGEARSVLSCLFLKN